MAGAASSHHSLGDIAARAAREAAAAAATGPNGVQDVLNTPVDRNADLAVAHAELEKARLHLAEHAKAIGTEKRRLEATVREYNSTHGIVPRVIEPAVLEELRISGRAVGKELAWSEHPAASGLVPQQALQFRGHKSEACRANCWRARNLGRR